MLTFVRVAADFVLMDKAILSLEALHVDRITWNVQC